MHTKGKNHTPNNSQSSMDFRNSVGAKISHPNPSVTYARYVMRRRGRERGGEGRDSGIPRASARDAAREKLSTEVTEMTVEARHMLRDLRSAGSGASSALDLSGSANTHATGATQRKPKSRVEDVCVYAVSPKLLQIQHRTHVLVRRE